MLAIPALMLAAVATRADDVKQIVIPRTDALQGLPDNVRLGPALPRHDGFCPAPGRYNYRASWQGSVAGTGMIAVQHQGTSNITVTVRADTNKVIQRLYTVSFRGEAMLTADGLLPIESHTREQTGSRKKLVSAQFQTNGIIETIEFKQRPGKEDQKTTLEYKTDGSLLDVFSAAFIAQSIQWSEGAEETLFVLLGRSRYLITLKCEGLQSADVGENGPRNVWCIAVTSEKVDPDDDEEENNKATATTRTFVADDETRDIVRVRIEAFFGRIDVDLTSFAPAGRTGGTPGK